MLKNARGSKWLNVLFFLSIILFFIYASYYVAVSYSNAGYEKNNLGISSALKVKTGSSGLVVLRKDQERTIDRFKLTFRGLVGDDIRLDVVLMDLDPHYAYRRRIPLDEAKSGIQLQGNSLKFVSANKKQLLLHLPK